MTDIESDLLIANARIKILEKELEERKPVVHGQWLDDQYFWRCSVCLEWLEVAQGTAGMNFCPHCGADMRGE